MLYSFDNPAIASGNATARGNWGSAKGPPRKIKPDWLPVELRNLSGTEPSWVGDSDQLNGKPEGANQRAAHHETDGALACADEDIEEFLAEFKILFRGKDSAGDGATCFRGVRLSLAYGLFEGYPRGMGANLRPCRQRRLQHEWFLQLRAELNTTNSVESIVHLQPKDGLLAATSP